MPRQVTVRCVGLRTCFINLPLSIYAPLIEKGVTPQTLIVELNWTVAGTTRKAYVGWSGLAARLPAAVTTARQHADVLEIDTQFARELSLKDGSQVTVNLKLSIPQAKSINICPLSADDWEVMELHAEEVENTMLSQVRAAFVGQPICVWAGKSKTFMRFTVDSTIPEETVRLGSQTEVIIAPKPRTRTTLTKSNQVDSLLQPTFDVSSRLFRLLPLELADFCRLSSAQIDSPDPFAVVSKSLYDSLIKIFPSGTCAITVQPLKRRTPIRNGPKSTMSASENDEPTSRKRDRDRRLAKSKGKSVQFVDSQAEGFPAGHIWLNSSARLALDGEDGGQRHLDYQLLRLEPIRSSSERLKVQPNGHLPSLTELATPLSATSLLNDPMDALASRAVDEITLAGVDDKIGQIAAHIRSAFKTWQTGSLSSGIAIRGSLGTGKTSLLKAVASNMITDADCLAYVQFIECSKYCDERPTVLKDKFREWFDEACWRSPTVLIFDNLDRMIPAEVEHIDPFRQAQIANLFVTALRSACSERPIICVISTASSTSLHSLISTAHVADLQIALRPPDKEARKSIISTMVSKKTLNSLIRPRFDYASVAAKTDGYLPADLRDLIDRALHQALIQRQADKPLDLTEAHFAAAQADFTPVSLKSIKLQQSDVCWDDIGGLIETRRILRETLEWPTKYARIFANCPLRLRSGLLLYGYPGCGKTLLASAAAKECGLNFISVKGPELLNKYIGASEKSVRDLFERAQAAQPCVLFFDEFDSIAPKRGHDSTGVTDRVVNQLLTQMDGAEGLEGVYVLAATSRPDLIDPALLRPGRLDKSLLCDMPDASDRRDILLACSRKMELDQDIDLKIYATKTEGYTGADLQALMYNAHLEAIHQSMTASTSEDTQAENTVESSDLHYTVLSTSSHEVGSKSRAEQDQDKKRLEYISSRTPISTDFSKTKTLSKSVIVVNAEHLDRAFQAMRPSMPATELRRLQNVYQGFVSGRSANGLPSNEPSNQIGGRSSLM